MELKEAVASRGYLKGTITRLYNIIARKEPQSTESLIARKERIVTSFSEYENLNKKILCLDPSDSEDVEAVEAKYFVILTSLNEELRNRECHEKRDMPPPASLPLTIQPKINLPSISIEVFTGKCSEYTPFINLFESIIHSSESLDHIQKLYYLRSYLKGEALDLVKNLPLTAESYHKALKLLDDRYNNKHKIVSDHINSILDMPVMQRSTSSNLREFVSVVKQHIAALGNLNPNVVYWDAIVLCILLRKLDSYTSRAYHLDRNMQEEATLQDFLAYLEKRATALENAEPGLQQHRTTQREQRPAVRVAAHVHTTAKDTAASCVYCKSDHKLYTCKKFQLTSVSDRIRFVNANKLCSTCLGAHNGKCRFHFRCAECKQGHNTLLHAGDPPQAAGQAASPTALAAGKNNDVLLPTAMVKLIGRNGVQLNAKALLDSGSQLSFATTKLVQQLGLEPTQTNTNVIGITNTKSNIKYCLPIELHSLQNPFKTTATCHIVDQITCNLPQTKIDLSKIKIPPGVQLADENFGTPSEIELLIGANIFFQVLLPTSVPLSSDKSPQHSSQQPCFIATQFGYIVGGNLPHEAAPNVCNKVSLKCTVSDSAINDNIAKFWKTEDVPEVFNETSSEQELCEGLFRDNVRLHEDGQFEVPLPLKLPLDNVNEALGDSFSLALKRFLNLEKKLHKDPALFSEYQKFIHDYLSLGHAHIVNIEDYKFNEEPTYFLPHHAVIKADSRTTKLRTVFDGSMKTNKRTSLNDLLLNGPSVQRELFDILLLFRLGKYTFTADIKKMFRNVKLSPEYTSLQNILWRDSPDGSIICIRLDTVTYGLKSSTYLATRCLDELANRHERDLPLASFILKNCTYTDDMLYAHNDLQTVLDAKAQLCRMLQYGKFQLHKWSSNCNEVLQGIPEAEQHFGSIELEQNDCSLKALGLHVIIKADQFKISCPEPFTSSKITKRSVLSYISRFYDPMGFASPIIVLAKAIMQKLWLSTAGVANGWDSELSGELREQWLDFASSLGSMAPIFVCRNISVCDTDVVDIIGFSDAASSLGYGCVIYLRVTQITGAVTVHLLCSKSRINPLKSEGMTIPRLELNAALLLAKLVARVANTISLKIKVSGTYLFTDSTIVLAWLRTNANNLQAYVANRVKVITQHTSNCQWLYVNTKDNPADYISRGMRPDELAACSMWWHGPHFLHDSKHEFNCSIDLPRELPETKSAASSSCPGVVAGTPTKDIFDELHKYSSIHKRVRILARILRFCNNVNGRSATISHNYLSSPELENAFMMIIQNEQQKCFSNEINSLKGQEVVKGSLLALHPFLDGKGLLRVGGRLHHADIPYSQRHPIILPKSDLTSLLIRSEHERLLHAGPKLLLANLSQRFWIISGSSQIKKVTSKCVVCYRQKAKAAEQLMGSLPPGRVTPCRPFERVGVDFAGPINVKLSRLRRSLTGKGYICVFVCFTTKAIHLELASDLTTETFLACLRRFFSRRGLASEIHCDNMSTFKCARNQLVELYKLASSRDHQAKVCDFASQNGIKFNFIPAYSPTFGGLWEAAVSSTKQRLVHCLKNKLLTYEQLNTVLVEIECILNCRPLIPMSSDVNSYSYLTPSHFLVGKALTMYPEHDLSNVSLNSLHYWKLCTQIKQSFWETWQKQYLNVLQNRPKWRKQVNNVIIGSLVILRDDNAPPMSWAMARVTNVFPGHDGNIRAVEVKTSNGKAHIRAINKLSLLPIDM